MSIKKLKKRIACLMGVHSSAWKYDNKTELVSYYCTSCGVTDTLISKLKVKAKPYAYFSPPMSGVGEIISVEIDDQLVTGTVIGLKTVWFLFNQERYYVHHYLIETLNGKQFNYVGS